MTDFDVFYDLMLDAIMGKMEFNSLEDVKSYLSGIDHPQKDNPSFIYEFYQFLKEPICIK